MDGHRQVHKKIFKRRIANKQHRIKRWLAGFSALSTGSVTVLVQDLLGSKMICNSGLSNPFGLNIDYQIYSPLQKRTDVDDMVDASKDMNINTNKDLEEETI